MSISRQVGETPGAVGSSVPEVAARQYDAENTGLLNDFAAGRYAAGLLMLRDPETRDEAQAAIHSGLARRARRLQTSREADGNQERPGTPPLPAQRVGPESSQSARRHEVLPFEPLSETSEGRDAAIQHLTQRAERLSEEEAADLEQVRHLGDLALKKLVEQNMGLVNTVVVHTKEKHGLHTETDDLMQKGVIGLMQAIEGFDPSQGATLATFAPWHIRQSVLRGERQETPVGFSHYILGVMDAVGKAERVLQGQDVDRKSSDKEIAHHLGIGVGTTRRARSAMRHKSVLALHAVVGEGGAEIGDFIPDQSASDPEEVAVGRAFARQILDRAFPQAIRRIDSQRRPGPKGCGAAQYAEYVKMYFGLPPYSGGASLREIAAVYGVSSPQGVKKGIDKFCAALHEALHNDATRAS